MGVFTYEHETSSVIPPARIFKAIILDADNFILKVAPQVIQKIEIIEGDGGIGSIRKVTFSDGGKTGFFKQINEVIDTENLKFHYSVIEGEVLGDKLEKALHEIKYLASPNGGTIVKTTDKFITKGDAEFSAEEAKIAYEKAVGLFKLFEAYLLANPDAYN
ncbi:Major allergen Mal d 1 [Quillaja saponaria]|uniref:Major allergen Mal d 1 n=1 Tax=Quillaja saponaria TaxID=32244 RepID=A0AAD7LBQ2_QUISA|nr:Major allergen Mal d 1 [Quillaja saponaria]